MTSAGHVSTNCLLALFERAEVPITDRSNIKSKIKMTELHKKTKKTI